MPQAIPMQITAQQYEQIQQILAQQAAPAPPVPPVVQQPQQYFAYNPMYGAMPMMAAPQNPMQDANAFAQAIFRVGES